MKKGSNSKKKTKNNKKLYIDKMKVMWLGIGFVLGLILMFFIAPNRKIKFEDGSQAILEFDGEIVTIDELYSYYQDRVGIVGLVNLIDSKMLRIKYKNLEKAANLYALRQAEFYYMSYEAMYKKTKEEFLSENNYTEETFISYLENEFFTNTYFKEYLMQFISEDDINKEYKNVFGSKSVYLFSTTDKTSVLEKIKNELKKGSSVDNIKKMYPDIVVNDLGDVSYVAISSYSENIASVIRNLNNNSVSNVIKDDSFGYVLVYVDKTQDKPSFEDAYDDIVTVLTQKKANDDSSLYYKAFVDLRKDANLVIYDKELNKDYNDYIKSIVK